MNIFSFPMIPALILPIVRAQTGPVIQCGGGKGVLPGCDPANPFNPTTITQTVFANAINIFLAALAFVAFGFLIKGGVDMILSKGNTEKVQTAQKTIITALIGLILATSSYILVQIAANIQIPSP